MAGAPCEYCGFYVYDEDAETYFCDVDLDEDDLARLMAGGSGECPYFQPYDEYKIVQKQN